MALYAWLYRYRRVCFLLLCVTSFWVAYLFLSLSPTGKGEHRPSAPSSAGSALSRQYFASVQPPGKSREGSLDSLAHRHDNQRQGDGVPPQRGGEGKAVQDAARDEGKLVLEPPQPVEDAEKVKLEEQQSKVQKNVSRQEQASGAEDGSVLATRRPTAVAGRQGLNASTVNATTAAKQKEAAAAAAGFGKLKELGEKLRNKTLEVGQQVKNKTLAVLGIGERQPNKTPAVLFHASHWNLSVSFEDIGNIMKDTAFLNRRSPLDLHAPVLMSSQNRSANYTLRLKSRQGYCDCWERHCVCCARLVQPRLHINNTLCSNFTFLSKSQEFDLVVSVDSKPIDKTVIQAHTPPVVCIGSAPKVADICVRFFNMTFKVNALSEHKTQLLGCTDLSLNLYNKTLTLVPVDCFQIPGDPNVQHADRPRFNDWPNWVP